jgi:hypothetical protein
MSKSRVIDEIFSGMWVWSFFYALASVALPIANERRHFGIAKEALLPWDIAIATGIIIVIGLSQWAAGKNNPPSHNTLRGIGSLGKAACLALVLIIDVLYSTWLIYLYVYQSALPLMWLGAGCFLDAVLLFGVFRLYFAKSDEA